MAWNLWELWVIANNRGNIVSKRLFEPCLPMIQVLTTVWKIPYVQTFSYHQLLLQALRVFFSIKSLSPRLKFPNARQDLDDYSCAVTWDELSCFVTASCAVSLHHSFSFCVMLPLKHLDRAELGGESCTVLLTRWALGLVFYIRDVAGSLLSTPASLRALLHWEKHDKRRSALHHTDTKYSLAPAHWTFFHLHMNAAASVPGITRNLGLATLAQLQSCFSLTSPLL